MQASASGRFAQEVFVLLVMDEAHVTARASVLVQRELEVQSRMISPLDGLCATAGEDGRLFC